MSPLSLQSLPASPESLCIVEMGGHEAKEDMEGGGGSLGGLFLNIGLQVSGPDVVSDALSFLVLTLHSYLLFILYML